MASGDEEFATVSVFRTTSNYSAATAVTLRPVFFRNIRGPKNPADLATRGLSPDDLSNSSLSGGLVRRCYAINQIRRLNKPTRRGV